MKLTTVRVFTLLKLYQLKVILICEVCNACRIKYAVYRIIFLFSRPRWLLMCICWMPGSNPGLNLSGFLRCCILSHSLSLFIQMPK